MKGQCDRESPRVAELNRQESPDRSLQFPRGNQFARVGVQEDPGEEKTPNYKSAKQGKDYKLDRSQTFMFENPEKVTE
ncbi:hypothetical protein NDU88_002873 [Pleurodeles waltl]|uniref:Uncharacterized protein n=1 Tax=Pleurodeles waltl TaxID=8319 RepID=A0AAV7V0X7_PLEWA|nr:hypothetical protein NDU88_002873 [Pleurodeles waltl]